MALSKTKKKLFGGFFKMENKTRKYIFIFAVFMLLMASTVQYAVADKDVDKDKDKDKDKVEKDDIVDGLFMTLHENAGETIYAKTTVRSKSFFNLVVTFDVDVEDENDVKAKNIAFWLPNKKPVTFIGGKQLVIKGPIPIHLINNGNNELGFEIDYKTGATGSLDFKQKKQLGAMSRYKYKDAEISVPGLGDNLPFKPGRIYLREMPFSM